jgi:hypothetical protein
MECLFNENKILSIYVAVSHFCVTYEYNCHIMLVLYRAGIPKYYCFPKQASHATCDS